MRMSRFRTLVLATSLVVAVAVLVYLIRRNRASDGSLDQVHVDEVNIEGHMFTVVSVDCQRTSVRLFWKQSNGTRYRNFETLKKALAGSHERLLFATNAGIFDPTFTPCGLHVEEGRELVPLNLGNGEGNFYRKPNGVFLIDQNGARIIVSGEYPGTHRGIRFATQSGPMLVADGDINLEFKMDSIHKQIRSGVGVVSPNQVVFAISREPVTFHDIAAVFKSRLKCRQALYLDGAICRFYLPSAIPDETSEFAGIIGVSAPE